MDAVIIRADGSSSIGIGHLMRCFALAEAAAQHGHKVHLISVDCPDSMRTRYQAIGADVVILDAEAFSPEDCEQTTQHIRHAGGASIVLDSYHITKDYVENLGANGVKTLCIDDTGRTDVLNADIILNQNFLAKPEWYNNKGRATKTLLGLNYVLLRSEFREPHIHVPDKNVLVTTGGSDDTGVTPAIVETILPIVPNGYKVNVIIGEMSPNRNLLENTYLGDHRVNLIVNPPEMHRHFLKADIVITGGGSTLWECLALGVPILTLVLAENQSASCQHLEQNDIARTVGSIEDDCFVERLSALAHNHFKQPAASIERAKRGKKLIDGQGVFRVLECLVQ